MLGADHLGRHHLRGKAPARFSLRGRQTPEPGIWALRLQGTGASRCPRPVTALSSPGPARAPRPACRLALATLPLPWGWAWRHPHKVDWALRAVWDSSPDACVRRAGPHPQRLERTARWGCPAPPPRVWAPRTVTRTTG